jgi:hypothetical protein
MAEYNNVIEACSEEISSEDELSNGLSSESLTNKHGARLLRATFYILCKKQKEAMEDLNVIIEDSNAQAAIRYSSGLNTRAEIHQH